MMSSGNVTGASACGGSCAGQAGVAHEQKNATRGERKRDPLLERERAAQRIRRVMLAEEFDAETNASIQHCVESDDLAIPMRPPQLRDQNQTDDGLRERLVELRGMQRNAERYAGSRVGIRESDRPRQMRGLAPATAGGETSETPDAMTDGESRGEKVGGCEHRQSLCPHVEVSENQSQDKSAEEDARALERGERENLARVSAKVGIECDH